MYTYFCRRNIHIAHPNNRFLLIQVPNVGSKMRIPNILLIESLKVLSGIGDVRRYDIAFLEFEGDDAPFDFSRGRVVGEGSVHMNRAYFG